MRNRTGGPPDATEDDARAMMEWMKHRVRISEVPWGRGIAVFDAGRRVEREEEEFALWPQRDEETRGGILTIVLTSVFEPREEKANDPTVRVTNHGPQGREWRISATFCEGDPTDPLVAVGYWVPQPGAEMQQIYLEALRKSLHA